MAKRPGDEAGSCGAGSYGGQRTTNNNARYHTEFGWRAFDVESHSLALLLAIHVPKCRTTSETTSKNTYRFGKRYGGKEYDCCRHNEQAMKRATLASRGRSTSGKAPHTAPASTLYGAPDLFGAPSELVRIGTRSGRRCGPRSLSLALFHGQDSSTAISCFPKRAQRGVRPRQGTLGVVGCHFFQLPEFNL